MTRAELRRRPTSPPDVIWLCHTLVSQQVADADGVLVILTNCRSPTPSIARDVRILAVHDYWWTVTMQPGAARSVALAAGWLTVTDGVVPCVSRDPTRCTASKGP